MENFDLLITGAQVVTMAGVFPRSIAIKDGVIKGLLAPDVQVPAQETWDFPGKIILPGGIDTHAHVSSREGFASGTATAAKAGFTTL
ncbi:MAG: allantoinase AllB, partial [Limnochordia bacterium]